MSSRASAVSDASPRSDRRSVASRVIGVAEDSPLPRRKVRPCSAIDSSVDRNLYDRAMGHQHENRPARGRTSANKAHIWFQLAKFWLALVVPDKVKPSTPGVPSPSLLDNLKNCPDHGHAATLGT